MSTDFGRVTPVVKTGNDDDFLPDFEEKEIEHLNRLESTIQVHKKPDNMLKHDEEVAGILYKYDLPVQNMPITFKSSLMLKDEEVPPTATESLFEALQLDKDTAYESFVIKLNQTYNNEIDMYGDIKKAGESSLKVWIHFNSSRY